MTNLILQVILGEGYADQPLVKLSTERARAWADRIGADYAQFTGPRKYKQVTAEKLNVFNEEYDKYDYIFVLDADMVATDAAPDPFEKYPYPISGMPCTGQCIGEHQEINQRMSGGSLAYSKEFRKMAREELKGMKIGENHCADEDAIKVVCEKLGIKPRCRAQQWDNYPPREKAVRKDFYLVHYVQNCRDKWFNEEDWK